jgi:hypothetical protein
VLSAQEGRRRKILLSLSVFKKKTRNTPLSEIEKAERRLADWRRRARPRPQCHVVDVASISLKIYHAKTGKAATRLGQMTL